MPFKHRSLVINRFSVIFNKVFETLSYKWSSTRLVVFVVACASAGLIYRKYRIISIVSFLYRIFQENIEISIGYLTGKSVFALYFERGLKIY